MAGKIFINYRRDDAAGDARNIRQELARKFGKNAVFMDVENLHPGLRFDKQLALALDQTDVLVTVIGPRWMELLATRESSGERDYVREEIAAALKREIPVIPVRVGREDSMPPLPREDQLPEDIRSLVLHQKLDAAHERFNRDIEQLISAISALRGDSEPATSHRAWVAAAAIAAFGVIGAGVWLASQRVNLDFPATAPEARVQPQAATEKCERFWSKIRDHDSRDVLEAFVAECGTTFHGKLAASRLKQIDQAAEAEAAKKKVAAAEQEATRKRAAAAAYGPPAGDEDERKAVSYFTWQTSPNEIDPGLRIWARDNDGSWQESWPSGHVTRSTKQARIVVDGCSGTVVARQDEPGLYGFIPDKGCKAMLFRFRRGTTGPWIKLALMQNVK